jgi:hypothetical protein
MTEVVNELRRGLLKKLSAMSSYCYPTAARSQAATRKIMATLWKRRTTATPAMQPAAWGDYNAYLSCFDLREQRQQQADSPPLAEFLR